MSLYAVIDTNVLVGALLSKHDDSAVAQVINLVADRENQAFRDINL